MPLRFIYDNNYFNDPWQGIPNGGYNGLIESLLDGVEVRLREYKYYDMDKTVARALALARSLTA